MARARYFDGERAVAYDVVPQVSGDALLIQTGDGTELARWPVTRIEARGEPDADGNILLACQGRPARLVAGADVVDALLQAGGRIRSPHAWTSRGRATTVLVIVAVIGLAFLSFEAGPPLVARLLPATWEDRLGGLLQTQMEKSHRICHGAAGQLALEALVRKLRAAGNIPNPVQIEVLDDPAVNALTLPGDRVVVLRGLIDTVQDGGELAGVIAHELGHVAHRDPVTLLVRQMGIGLIAASLGWNDSLPNAGGIAQQLLALSYSRRAEAAADAAGEAFLTKAGLRADGLGRFFAHEETIEGHGGEIRWFATHPPTAERRAHATRSTTGAPPFTDAAWQAVRRICD